MGVTSAIPMQRRLYGGCSRILLEDNDIHSAGAKAIAAACGAAGRIGMLDLSGNPIGDQGAGYVAMGELLR